MAPRASAPPISVLVVDDHRAVAEAIRDALAGDKAFAATAAWSGEEALGIVERDWPDVVLMDVTMPGMGGLEATRRISELAPGVKVIMLSAHDDDLVRARAIEAGALGYLSKISPMGDLVEAVRRATRGDPLVPQEEVDRLHRRLHRRRSQDSTERQRAERLSLREIEILQLMADGIAPPEIAARLHISQHTLRTHVQNILTKLGVHSKVDAIVVAIRHGKVSAAT
ncbi:MAG TPA: response regulator transcription factor [Actinomycetota bacterium]